jgi:hypothetical protein
MVDVQAIVEVAGLGRTAKLSQREALARGLRPAAGKAARLDHGHVIAGLGQLIGGGEAGIARAQHDHLVALRRAAQLRRRGHRRTDAEAQRIHARKQHRAAAHATQGLEKIPASWAARGPGPFKFSHRPSFRIRSTRLP